MQDEVIDECFQFAPELGLSRDLMKGKMQARIIHSRLRLSDSHKCEYQKLTQAGRT